MEFSFNTLLALHSVISLWLKDSHQFIDFIADSRFRGLNSQHSSTHGPPENLMPPWPPLPMGPWAHGYGSCHRSPAGWGTKTTLGHNDSRISMDFKRSMNSLAQRGLINPQLMKSIHPVYYWIILNIYFYLYHEYQPGKVYISLYFYSLPRINDINQPQFHE